MSYWTDILPKEWTYQTLDKSVSHVVDNRGRTCPVVENGIPLIATNCIKEFGLYPVFEKVRFVNEDTYENWFRGHPEPNDILFVNKGTPGGVCLVPDPVPFCIAQDMVALRPDSEQFDWKFFFASLRSRFVRTQVEAMNVGTSIPHLKKTDFDRIVIPKPPKSEQEVIGELYFTLSNKIELNLQQNKTLEEMAMSLYKHWFVDFGPFQDGEFVESELGMIPKGWEVKSLSEITIELRRGISPKYIEEGGIRVINQKCIRNHLIDYSLTRRNDPELRKVEGRLILVGDVLVNSTGVGTLGRMAQVFSLDEETVVDSHVTVVRANSNYISKYTFGRLMLSLEKFVESLGIGSTGQTELSRSVLGESSVVVAPLDVQETLEERFKDFADRIDSNISENQTLTNLRDTLLPKLISGEIRVKEAQELIKDQL